MPTSAANPKSLICDRKRLWLSFTISGIQPRIPFTDTRRGGRVVMAFGRFPSVSQIFSVEGKAPRMFTVFSMAF
jgi:hypothetical protein